MTQHKLRILCEGNVMHRVTMYVVGPQGFVECLAEEQSQPAPSSLATPHPDSSIPRSELFCINYVRFYGNVTEEVI